MRKASFKILYDVFFNDILLNNAINNYFASKELKEEDKSLIKRETTGTIEKIDEIDNIINKYSKVKSNKLNKDILVVLRLGIYELKFMDKIPAYATINEYVNIIKKSKSSKLSGYVNAILRNIYRDEEKKANTCDNVTKRNVIGDKKNCYFIVYNEKEDELLNELEEKRINYSKYIGALNFKYASIYSVNKYKDIIDTENFRSGNAFIEDASSIYMVDKLADLINDVGNNSLNILDTCSSPGGKILSLIDTLKKINKKIILNAVLCDISKDKIDKIKENIDRVRFNKRDNLSIKLFVKDATVYDKCFDDKFDVVICDVPCTGLGVISKKPDIKIKYTDEKRDSLALIQRKILDVSKMYLKVGGILSYSTCTTTKEENSSNIRSFLQNNKNFRKVFEKQIEPNDENNADGFYMCFMNKE